MNAKSVFAKRFKKLRKEKNISAEDIKNQLDLSHVSVVYEWEKDRFLPDIDTLIKIGKILDVKIDDLVNGESPIPHTKTRDELIKKITDDIVELSYRDLMKINEIIKWFK